MKTMNRAPLEEPGNSTKHILLGKHIGLIVPVPRLTYIHKPKDLGHFPCQSAHGKSISLASGITANILTQH